jgi:hypothetical protein
MSLSVPPVRYNVTTANASRYYQQPAAAPSVKAVEMETVPPIEVKFDKGRQEIIFENSTTCPVRNGDWIVITTASKFSHSRFDLQFLT